MGRCMLSRPAPVQLTGRHFIILDSKLQLYQQIPRHSPGDACSALLPLLTASLLA